MAVMNMVRCQKVSPWAIKAENYLLLLRRDELVELLRMAGQSVSTLKHKSREKIRQTLLSLPRETLAMGLRERVRQQNRWFN